MKSLKKYLLIFLASTVLITQSGCFGSFKLTNAVYEVNKNVGDKVVNEVVFLLLVIIPVYEVAGIVDLIVLNAVEFWTGTNPLSMNEGDIEIKEVKSGEKLYQITATKNKFNIEQIEGPDAGKNMDIIYNPDSQIWSVNSGNNSIEVLKMIDDKKVKILNPFGIENEIDLSQMDKNQLLQNI